MYPPFVRNNVPFIPSYTFGISTTRPSRWSPRSIIFSTSFFAHHFGRSPFFTLLISPDSFFRARDDAWDHFSLSLGTISTLCPDTLLPRFTHHFGRSPFFTLLISPDSFFRARDDAWDHFLLSLGTIATLRPYTSPHSFARHIGCHQIISHFLHEPSTPVILQMSRYFDTIHPPRKEAHQCSPPPSVLVIINIPWLNTSSLPGHSFCSSHTG